MAYVAISNGLVESTMNNIDTMRNKEKAALGEVPQEIRLDPEDALAIEMSWGVHKHLRETLPDDWTQNVDNIQVRIEVQDTENWNTDFYIKPQHDRFRVPNLRSNGYNSITTLIPETHSFALTVAARHLEHRKQCRAIDNKWKAIREQVKSFLHASKSLNEALKLWPALALYISDNYVNKVNENVAKSKTVSRAADILANINTDDITAAAVSVKLT